MENLSESQKSFAAVLQTKPLTVKQLVERANNDGAYIKRPNWGKLIELKIAKRDRNEFDEIVLSRGPRWLEFHDKYGFAIAERGLTIISIQEELGPIFST
jgi:hypothetical protein